MFQGYSLYLKSTFYVLSKLFSKSTVYVPILQLIAISAVYKGTVPRVQSLFQEYILCHKSINYVPRVQSMSQYCN